MALRATALTWYGLLQEYIFGCVCYRLLLPNSEFADGKDESRAKNPIAVIIQSDLVWTNVQITSKRTLLDSLYSPPPNLHVWAVKSRQCQTSVGHKIFFIHDTIRQCIKSVRCAPHPGPRQSALPQWNERCVMVSGGGIRGDWGKEDGELLQNQEVIGTVTRSNEAWMFCIKTFLFQVDGGSEYTTAWFNTVITHTPSVDPWNLWVTTEHVLQQRLFLGRIFRC